VTAGSAVRLSDLSDLADTLTSWPRPGADDVRLARVRIADACVACLATGAGLGGGSNTGPFGRNRNGDQPGAGLSGGAVLARSVASRIRYSEIDDILLESCVTPGSVVVPALLAAATIRPEASADELAAAAGAGYATLALCGGLLGGAESVAHGQWPTRAAAALGAAATAAVALGLDAAACRQGLALAAGLAWHGKAPEPAREIVFGWAVETGVRCALLAAQGGAGDPAALRRWPAGGEPAAGALTLRPDAIAAARIKPLCAARQVLPAITCLLAIAGAQRARHTEPAEITAVDVWLSRPCLAFGDRPRVATRLDSIASIQYQAAAAVWAPGVLWDVTRDELSLLAQSQSMAALLRLHEDPALTREYPARWPARVIVTTRHGSYARDEPDSGETAAGPLAEVRDKAARLFPADSATRRASDDAIARCLTFGDAAGLTAILRSIDAAGLNAVDIHDGDIDEGKEAHAS
jgi:2-methylcitrate dehydratase PrpD